MRPRGDTRMGAVGLAAMLLTSDAFRLQYLVKGRANVGVVVQTAFNTCFDDRHGQQACPSKGARSSAVQHVLPTCGLLGLMFSQRVQRGKIQADTRHSAEEAGFQASPEAGDAMALPDAGDEMTIASDRKAE